MKKEDFVMYVVMVVLSFLILYYASKFTIANFLGEKFSMILIAILIYLIFIFYIILKSTKRKNG